MELRLTLEEEQLVAEVLRHYQRELRLEISHTDHYDFKSRLRERAQLLSFISPLSIREFCTHQQVCAKPNTARADAPPIPIAAPRYGIVLSATG